MAIAELDKFRQKFPEYNDMDDTTLATKLSTKFPEYSDLVSKVKSGVPETKPSLYSEAIAPILEGGSTFALGAPRLLARAQGKAAEEATFPEQQTLPGKILRGVAETVGFAGGGIGRIAANVGKKVLPKLAVETLKRKALRMGTEGAVAGALLPPQEGIVNVPGRAENAVTVGAVSGAVPYAGAMIKGTGQVLAKSGRWVAKNSGGITDSTVATIKRLGADRVFDPLKAKADYVVQDLAPRVQQELSKAVNDFTPSIQKFAQTTLKMPLSAISTIKNRTVAGIDSIRQAYGDSTDSIFQGIQRGFKTQADTASKAFDAAWKGIPKNAPVKATETFNTLKSVLSENGLLDKSGSITAAAENPAVKDSSIGKALNLYKLFTGESGTAPAVLTKEQFQLVKSTLDDLPFDKPSYVKIIRPLRESIYRDAEATGAKGLQQARALYKKMSDMEGKYLDSTLTKEKSLDNFHKLSKEQVRQLKDIENYTHFKFVDDLDALTAGRYLDKLNRTDTTAIAKDLLHAKNPEWTKAVEKEYTDLLGAGKFKAIHDDLMAHFANTDFNLVSDTPSAGGGIYTGPSGLRKAAISGAAKIYYKNVAPKIEAGTKVVGKALPQIKKGVKDILGR